MISIPKWVSRSSEWSAALHILMNTTLERKGVDRFIDFEDRSINFTYMIREAEPWSISEQLLVKAAWDLFNSGGHTLLADVITYLDDTNLRVVLEAVAIRRKLSFEAQDVD